VVQKINLMKNFRVKPTFIALSAICITFFFFLGIMGHEYQQSSCYGIAKTFADFFLITSILLLRIYRS
jgi:glucan phosphoethanolaminetransferase (alkaline phosphatase superfamily)